MGTISQFIIFPAVWILCKLFFIKVEFRHENNFEKIVDKPSIIIANHISLYDSFLLRFSVHWKSMRVYFMGVTKFNSPHMRFLEKIGFISIVYQLFGVFTVTPGLGLEKNLAVPQKILEEGNVVFIFPEGNINTTKTLLPFKHGAAALAVKSGVPVLPIGFRDIKKEIGKKIIISIGEPVTFLPTLSYEIASNRLQMIIQDLITVKEEIPVSDAVFEEEYRAIA